jgi:hypothetical protein
MNYFLVFFIDFFIFLNLNSNLNFGGVYTARYRYRTPAVTAVTAVYRAVPSGKKNPASQSLSYVGSRMFRSFCIYIFAMMVDVLVRALCKSENIDISSLKEKQQDKQ